MSVKKPKRHTRTPIAINDEAAAALQERCTAQAQSLQHMERTLREIGHELEALRARIRVALALARGLPEDIRAADLPDGCPGWGNYATDLMTCGLCQWNLDCMTADE